jgi:hypothetical protein
MSNKDAHIVKSRTSRGWDVTQGGQVIANSRTPAAESGKSPTCVWPSLVIGLALLFASPLTASAVVHPPDVTFADFIPRQVIDNPYFPLLVGTFFLYEGTKEGVPTRDEICVTRQTKLIEDVQVTVVHHRSFEGSPLSPSPVEDTKDWFAQDVFSNVWYFGEDTVELPGGSREGSWEAGVDDADAGFIMLAYPQVGDRYFQEFARNVALDQAKVLSRTESVTVHGVPYTDVLLTRETSQLDPGVVEYKYYAPGVGFILGVMVKGGDERTELVSVGTCSE